MGRSSNPMQEHHKKKHLKELQKNKQQRIKARDDKVVQTKTVSGVKEEIRNLKRRKNLQHSEKQKLQRLEKELKLVQAAAANKPKIFQPQQLPQKPLTELDDPRKSVYYDEKLNPYGAPPPGKPRLYHHRGGGVTMDVRLAVVPGEPPPPPSHQRQVTRREEIPPLPRESPPRRRTPSPPPLPPSPEEEEEEETENESVREEEKPLVIPALPPPSQAVKRSRRGKATIDIWASTEEVEYERRANKIDLEADNVGAVVSKKKTKKKKPPLEYHYQDMSGSLQGPYKKAQMQEWFQAGFFPPTTLVKSNRNDSWVPIADVQALQESPAFAPAKETIEDRIAALRNDDSVQDRINALKKESSVEERIAALKGQNVLSEENQETTTSVQDRVAALRASSGPEHQVPGDGDPDANVYEPPADAGVPPPPPPPKADGDYTPQVDDMVPPPYPVDDVAPYPVDDEAGSASYPIDDEAGPAPYPVDDETEPAPYPLDEAGLAPYPVDNEASPAPYPIDEGEGPAPYAVDESDGIAPYPADVAYPVDEAYPGTEDAVYPVTGAYPAIDSYPDSANAHGGDSDKLQNYPVQPEDEHAVKKTIKVDKEVVAFLPSHMQSKKRRAQMSSETRRKKHNTAQKGPKIDEYDKFMEEIDGL